MVMWTVFDQLKNWFGTFQRAVPLGMTLMEVLDLSVGMFDHSHYQVRFAAQNDYHWLIELQKLCYEGKVLWDCQDFIMERHRNPLALHILIEERESGKVVAAITGRFEKRHSHVSHLMVHPNCQRIGLGRHLLELWLSQSQAYGLSYVTLEVPRTNRPARQLYEQAGFHIQKIVHRYYETGEDALYMQRIL